VNPYDPYVANTIVDGVQIPVCWYVDDLKISRRDETIVSTLVIVLAEEFGSKTTISRGNVHAYPGTELDVGTCPDTLVISIIKYLHKVIDEFPEVLRGPKACPTGDISFKIQEDRDREILCEEMAKHFHRTTAQLLFLCNQTRLDVETLISLLTTRVK
jgi:hypothetical protein